MENVGILNGHLEYFASFGIRTLWPFGNLEVHMYVLWYIFPALVYCVKKNLATTVMSYGEVKMSCQM
jgi:hypothetical protein